MKEVEDYLSTTDDLMVALASFNATFKAIMWQSL
jgi:hypothetical protein